MTAQEIKEARKKLGLTQQELVEAIGGNLSTLRHWEQGVHKINKFAADAISRLLEHKGVKHE